MQASSNCFCNFSISIFLISCKFLNIFKICSKPPKRIKFSQPFIFPFASRCFTFPRNHQVVKTSISVMKRLQPDNFQIEFIKFALIGCSWTFFCLHEFRNINKFQVYFLKKNTVAQIPLKLNLQRISILFSFFLSRRNLKKNIRWTKILFSGGVTFLSQDPS